MKERIYRTGTFQHLGAKELEMRLTKLMGRIETETQGSELMTTAVVALCDARRELQGMRSEIDRLSKQA